MRRPVSERRKIHKEEEKNEGRRTRVGVEGMVSEMVKDRESETERRRENVKKTNK